MLINRNVVDSLAKFAKSENSSDLEESWKIASGLPEETGISTWAQKRAEKLASVLEVIKATIAHREKLPKSNKKPSLNVSVPGDVIFDAGADPSSIKDKAVREAYEKTIEENRSLAKTEAVAVRYKLMEEESISYLKSFYQRQFEKQAAGEFKTRVIEVLGEPFYIAHFAR